MRMLDEGLKSIGYEDLLNDDVHRCILHVSEKSRNSVLQVWREQRCNETQKEFALSFYKRYADRYQKYQ